MLSVCVCGGGGLHHCCPAWLLTILWCTSHLGRICSVPVIQWWLPVYSRDSIPRSQSDNFKPVAAPCYKLSHTVDKDFGGFTHELTFDPSGEKTLIFSVILHDDQVPEPPEYFNVNVSTEQPRVNIGHPSLPLVEIADNDSERHSLTGTSVQMPITVGMQSLPLLWLFHCTAGFVAVTLGSSNYIVLESTGHVEVCVTLNFTYPADIPIIIQSSNGQGTQTKTHTYHTTSLSMSLFCLPHR